jgi:predicted glycoside hydrolase/deacetylase ChbG (UPF0249 family)
VRTVVERAKPAEVEIELRAQVERALTMGIRPTHLDSHMGALFATPELMATYAKVARHYKLPFLAYIGTPRPANQPILTDKDIVLDAVIIADGRVPRDKWPEFYLNAIANLKPGLTEFLVHLGRDDAELQAVTVGKEPFGATWRQKDFDVVRSAAFKKALKDNNVILVTWRDLHKLMQ